MAIGSTPNTSKPAERYRDMAGSLPSVAVSVSSRIPPLALALSMAVSSSARAAFRPRAASVTYMPMTNALCLVLGFAENSSATVPTSSSPSNAPKASVSSVGSAMRLTQNDSGSLARSSAVDVKASGASSYASSRSVRYRGASKDCRRATCMWILRPNVRAKLAPTVGRQAQATENVHRTRGLGLVAHRWCSA